MWQRLYVWPFVLLYSLWGGAWIYLTRINPAILRSFLAASVTPTAYPWLTLSFWIQYEEFMLIPLAFLGMAHFLAVMSCSWSVKARAFISARPVRSIKEAESILVVPVEHRGKAEMCPISLQNGTYRFSYQQLNFYWCSDRQMFLKPAYPEALPVADYLRAVGLAGEDDVSNANERFGRNTFDIPVPTFMNLFKEHVKAPFFVFQIFCVGLWCLDEYWYYSLFTLFMLVVFESTLVSQRLKTMEEFRGMSIPPVDVWVRRGGKWQIIKSTELVPGDLCAIPFDDKVENEGLPVPCDLVLLQGSCIVNEAMISGESTPLLKESLFEADGDDVLDLNEEDRGHVLFGGTKILQIHAATNLTLKEAPPLDCPFVVGYAARTGFGTLQGALVRTMIHSSEHVSANSYEAFLFIGFLMIFALIASGYVLVKGVEEEGRNRYKLLLECTMIITVVVPPELLMQLSMAVNNSLQQLGKFAIFCMEPFRIPFAGKLDICCFDKTGTLTAENLIVEGVAGFSVGAPEFVQTDAKVLLGEAPHTHQVMSVCHSLFQVRDGSIAGDPMERATLEFCNSQMGASDCITSGSISYQILHRFPFSSALKRMSVLARAGKDEVFVATKGAPEVLQSMFASVPTWYQETFTSLAQSGARVLALGYRRLPTAPLSTNFKHSQRAEFERDLQFCGFLVFRCPMKKDSKAALKVLKESAHQLVMITGDNALTAIHTAHELEMIDKKCEEVLLFDVDEQGKLVVIGAADGKVVTWLPDLSTAHPQKTLDLLATKKVSLCFTGSGYDALTVLNAELSLVLLPQTAIFARTSPAQKESILARLKSPPLSLHTLMCGDGTNDVGALKQAHIGMALLDGRPEDLPKILKEMRERAVRKTQKSLLEHRKRWATSAGQDANVVRMEKMLESLEAAEQEGSNLVRLGDASVAAPFTSKISTIQSVCHLIRQGRCALVTTIQMYKILALNSLITAYSLSVLHLSGIRYGDFQVTVSGMLISACFMFLTRSQPVKEMSSARPQSNIFNAYLLSSVLLQFFLHVAVLIYVTRSAARFEIPWAVTQKLKFKPGLMNTAVYLLGLIMQLSTFVVNYQGRPFRESLLENKPLRNSLAAVGCIAGVAALEIYPEFNEWLELVPMPELFKWKLVSALVVDLFGCLAIEQLSKRLFFSHQPILKKVL